MFSMLGVLDYPETDILIAECLVLSYQISILIKLKSTTAASIICLVRAIFVLIFIYLILKPILISIV
jgi:hypothetical protein